jgi:hypothetical protein
MRTQAENLPVYGYVNGLLPLFAGSKLEFHHLIFKQDIAAVDVVDMDKNLGTILFDDETIPLLVVEPLYFTFWHCPPPFKNWDKIVLDKKGRKVR